LKRSANGMPGDAVIAGCSGNGGFQIYS